MKGSTSLRRFCWLQVNFNYGHLQAFVDDRFWEGRTCAATHELSVASLDEQTMSARVRLQADKLCR